MSASDRPPGKRYYDPVEGEGSMPFEGRPILHHLEGKNGSSHEDKVLSATLELTRRFTMLEEHLLETRHLMRVATFPSRLPLWFIAGALTSIALSLLAIVGYLFFWKS